MRVVLDTNVIVSGLRSMDGASFRLLDELRRGSFELALSVPVFLEYESVLKRPGCVPVNSEGIDRLLRIIAQVAHAQEIFFVWRPFLKDPGDEMFLELAVAAKCEVIVTFNQRDFAGIESLGISVVTPGEFLHRLHGSQAID